MDWPVSAVGQRIMRSATAQLSWVVVAALLAVAARGDAKGVSGMRTLPFVTRGVVICVDDLSLKDWPERAEAAGLTTIALSPPPGLAEFLGSQAGRDFLATCRRLEVQVEYEFHAASELLPRNLFEQHPDYFRMDDEGKRTADANLCVSSEGALEIACTNAAAMCKLLRPLRHRYFFWTDDNQPMCRCPQCREYSDSEQALILENRLLAAIRKVDPQARLAHLAYGKTWDPPRKVKPSAGIFLEFAPFHRNHRVPLTDPANKAILDGLDANLKVFAAAEAQVLEYWTDVSMASDWKKPATKLDLNVDLLRDDLRTYAARGIRQVTSFAVFLDGAYAAKYGAGLIEEYGRGFQNKDEAEGEG